MDMDDKALHTNSCSVQTSKEEQSASEQSPQLDVLKEVPIQQQQWQQQQGQQTVPSEQDPKQQHQVIFQQNDVVLKFEQHNHHHHHLHQPNLQQQSDQQQLQQQLQQLLLSNQQLQSDNQKLKQQIQQLQKSDRQQLLQENQQLEQKNQQLQQENQQLKQQCQQLQQENKQLQSSNKQQQFDHQQENQRSIKQQQFDHQQENQQLQQENQQLQQSNKQQQSDHQQHQQNEQLQPHHQLQKQHHKQQPYHQQMQEQNVNHSLKLSHTTSESTTAAVAYMSTDTVSTDKSKVAEDQRGAAGTGVECENSMRRSEFVAQSSIEVDGLPSLRNLSLHGSHNVSSSGAPQSHLHNLLSESKQTSAAASSSQNTRKDFVLLNADEDEEEAHEYAEHLRTDVGKDHLFDLTVDVFSNIDSGQTDLDSAEKLHDIYNHILVLGTENLKNDKFKNFLQESILTKGLQDGNGKEDRVIPVWTNNGCKRLIFALSSLGGFDYYKYKSNRNSLLGKSYLKCVQRTIENGRMKHHCINNI